MMTLHNFSDKPTETNISMKKAAKGRLVDLMKNVEIEPKANGRYSIALEAFGYRWFRARP